MPSGKPAGVRCIQLADDHHCRIFGQPDRPTCCAGLAPSPEMCGQSRADALRWLTQLEIDTAPQRGTGPAPALRHGSARQPPQDGPPAPRSD